MPYYCAKCGDILIKKPWCDKCECEGIQGSNPLSRSLNKQNGNGVAMALNFQKNETQKSPIKPPTFNKPQSNKRSDTSTNDQNNANVEQLKKPLYNLMKTEGEMYTLAPQQNALNEAEEYVDSSVIPDAPKKSDNIIQESNPPSEATFIHFPEVEKLKIEEKQEDRISFTTTSSVASPPEKEVESTTVINETDGQHDQNYDRISFATSSSLASPPKNEEEPVPAISQAADQDNSQQKDTPQANNLPTTSASLDSMHPSDKLDNHDNDSETQSKSDASLVEDPIIKHIVPVSAIEEMNLSENDNGVLQENMVEISIEDESRYNGADTDVTSSDVKSSSEADDWHSDVPISPSDNSNEICLRADSEILTFQDDPSHPIICTTCSKPILGFAMQATNKSYHPECFVCGYCSKRIGEKESYADINEKSYHENCYYECFGEKCSRCGMVLCDTAIKALGMKYHPSCFVCSRCHNALTNTFFHKKNEILCLNCHEARRLAKQKN